MALTAVGEPTPTTAATGGAGPGGSEAQPTSAPTCQQPDTPSRSAQENGEGLATAPGEYLPPLATHEPGENGTGPLSVDAGGAASTSPTSSVAGATTAVVPGNEDAAGAVGGGCGGEGENNNTVGADQPNLEFEGSSARLSKGHGEGGGGGVGAAGPASTQQEDGPLNEAPVRMAP